MHCALRLVLSTFGMFAVALPLAAVAAPVAPAQVIVDAATTDAEKRAAFIRTGQRLADFCANCHGANGTSKKPDVPNLAGQNVIYLSEQFRKYLSRERRDDSKFKAGLIKLLKDEEKAAVAYYYAQSQPIPARSITGPNAARGKALYSERCAQCHGENGSGAETIPRMAGQQPDYLKISLNRYRKVKADRIFVPMQEVMLDLTESDVAALVDYLSSMR